MSIKNKIKAHIRKYTRNYKCIDGSFAKLNRVNLEWWSQKRNVGDCISPVVCEYMLSLKGLSLQSRVKRTCHLTAVGSVCGAGFFDSVVWGSGIHHQVLMDHVKKLKGMRKLDIRAVRGPETEKYLNEIGISCPKIYGDPAIIMPEIYKHEPSCNKKYPVSLVVHISMKGSTDVPEGIHLIDIETADYRTFIDELCDSEKVISSSLHGIILSESYGIPAVFYSKGMDDQMMKYKDWYYSTGRRNFKYTNNLKEAIAMEPEPLPHLNEMRKSLKEAFPYDIFNTNRNILE